ncbi:hypothetical protein [Joostella sp. CR20]|uniref:hypothetical protein n=1 Tax=Joostella sp. CR20 TaxID=2804312 RepID=UPI00313ADFEC
MLGVVLVLLFVIGVPYLGYVLFTSVFDSVFGTGNDYENSRNPTHIHFHEHKVEQHLHVTENQLDKLRQSSTSSSEPAE